MGTFWKPGEAWSKHFIVVPMLTINSIVLRRLESVTKVL
jgi:hypothetical protein